jgi:hypothetical protein
MRWRNWIEDEWPQLAIWMVALVSGYFTWLVVISLWEDNVADYLGAALAVGVSLSILRLWQMFKNRREGNWNI